MGIELQMVAGTVGVLFLLLMYQGSLVPLNQGFAWGLGSRDAKQDHTAMQTYQNERKLYDKYSG